MHKLIAASSCIQIQAIWHGSDDICPILWLH